jgi:hypothetical protein
MTKTMTLEEMKMVSGGTLMGGLAELVGICRPVLLTSVCSFEFHVTGSGVEAVRDAPLLSLKLL